MIAKRRGSPYEHRRSPHWLKMKCEATQELVVGGFTDPQGARVGLAGGARRLARGDRGGLRGRLLGERAQRTDGKCNSRCRINELQHDR